MQLAKPLAVAAALWQLPLAGAVENGFHGEYVDKCPLACTADSSEWMRYVGFDRFKPCDQPMIMQYNTDVENVDSTLVMRACSLSPAAKAQADPVFMSNDTVVRRSVLAAQNGCGVTSETAEFQLSSGSLGASGSSSPNANFEMATAAVSSFLNKFASCGSDTVIARVGNAVVGFYGGADLQKSSTSAFMKKFADVKGDTFAQVCDSKANKFDTTVGAIRGTFDNFNTVHSAVKAWSQGKCLEQRGATTSSISLVASKGAILASVSNNSTVPASNGTTASLSSRGTCRDTQVESGDTCASIAANKCHIPGDDFMRYNSNKPNLCSTLMEKQYVCCSEGSLYDHRPQPESDGSCKVHSADAGDGCWNIASNFGITQQDIEDFNKNTWGWAGCSQIQLHQKMCISRGSPPFPVSIPDTQCGPQVVGTQKPEGTSDYAGLNPCPLNACCDVWGYCGMTEEFCTPSPADTGAPGTAKRGTNGCISNCGTDIKHSGPPDQFRKIAYFEGWNFQRKCLHMNADVLGKDYTHVHFSFATVSADWQVVIDDKIKGQFETFKKIQGAKKILSFGGWAFSTEQGTYSRFRDATRPENRDAFAKNAAKFMSDNGLDGLDFDWEYPGAPDIPDIPPGGAEEGSNYLKFLVALRSIIGRDKSLSIALPSSYWYLRPYKLSLLHRTLDYFIYMTYDLHGQWDYNNKWTSPGCPTGNCVRSHINMTETMSALAMITKAGVPSNKVVVGVASYGRSFRLQDAGCTGMTCLYTGSPLHSDAYPGRCTDTSGYIANAELKEIKDGGNGGKYAKVDHHYDAASDSNIMMYGEDGKMDWVAYMDDDIKSRRTQLYRNGNFGGTTDWAVDLVSFQSNDGGDNPDVSRPPPHHDPPSSPGNKVCTFHSRAGADQITGGINIKYKGIGHRYVIVNLTPHKFVLDGFHSYQYKLDPKSVEAFSSLEVKYIENGGSSRSDDNAEIYYKVEGTDRKFVVHLTTHDERPVVRWDLTDMGMGSRELRNDVSLTLVITGSDSNGFHSSLVTERYHSNWMQSIKSSIEKEYVKDVVMPGTHDSAMSYISGKINTAAGSSNTQTQGRNIYDQLRMGARFFDLRIASIHNIITGNADFWGTHVNDEKALACIGNTGEMLEEIIDHVNRFTTENPGEVIIMHVKYLVGIRSTPSYGPIYWDQDRIDRFIGMLRAVNNRCLNLKGQVQDMVMGDLMGMNENKGCVLFYLQPTTDGSDRTWDHPQDGIYTMAALTMRDDWAEQQRYDNMAKHEINNIPTSRSNIHVMQWLMSSTDFSSAADWNVKDQAIYGANPFLYHDAVNAMGQDKYPTVIMVDYLGVENSWNDEVPTLASLALGLNLAIHGSLCKADSRRRELVGIDGPSHMGARDAAAQWNGFMDINGTKFDKPLPDSILYTGVPSWASLNRTSLSGETFNSTTA